MRLAEVELFVVRLPLVRSFETSFAAIAAREFVLVAARDGDVTGWGECVADVDPFYSAETTTTAWHILSAYLVPAVLGRSFETVKGMTELWPPVRGHRMAKAALEMAVWDLQARREGRPLCEVLGARRRPIAAGVSVGIQPTVEALVARVSEELEAGYQRVKIKIKPGWDHAPVEALRRDLGAIPLMVDANAAYTVADFDRLARLDQFDLMMVEQPLDYDDLVDHARLQAAVATPVCLDESITGPKAAADALGLGACRLINIKPGRMGGLGPSIAVHDLARQAGIAVWHGGMLESGIGRSHNLHLSTLPGFALPGDVAASKRYFQPDLIDPPVEVAADGTIVVPPGPGIGVDPVPDRLTAATLRSERFS